MKEVIKNIMEDRQKQFDLKNTSIKNEYVLSIQQVISVVEKAELYKYDYPMKKMLLYLYKNKDEFKHKTENTTNFPICAYESSGALQLAFPSKALSPGWVFSGTYIRFINMEELLGWGCFSPDRSYFESSLFFNQEKLREQFNKEMNKHYMNYKKIRYPFI